jgi:ubiquinone/menaquinone biosynthesis C-methylase UbiE
MNVDDSSIKGSKIRQLHQPQMPEDIEKVLMIWDKEPGRLNMTNKIAQAMLNRTSPRGTEVLLDYGTGTGLIALVFYSSVTKIVAVDSSKDMLAFLQKKLNAASIKKIKPQEWSIGDDLQKLPTFDIIIVSLTLHHVMDTALAAEVFHSLLNPGGIIAVADLDPDNGESHRAEMIVHNGFIREDLEEIFNTAGFTDIQFEDVATLTKVSSKTKEIKDFPIFLMIAYKAK